MAALNFDALAYIGAQIDDPGAFMSFAQVNSECAQIARDLAPIKKAQFVREIDSLGEHFWILPNGRRHGQRSFYRPLRPRSISVICHYDNGQLHGPYVQYYTDGTIHTLAYYHQGRPLGLYLNFGQDDKIIGATLYLTPGDYTLRIATYGQIRSISWLKNSQLHGLAEEFVAGHKRSVSVYLRGIEIVKAIYPRDQV